MHIGEIGNIFNSTQKVEYHSDRTLLEFDALIISFDKLLMNSGSFTSDIFEKRSKRLDEFLHYKKVPIIYFTPYPRKINIKYLHGVQERDFNFFAPIPFIKVENESGKQVEVIKNTPFSDLFTKYANDISYRSFFTSRQGTVTLVTSHVKRILSFYDDKCVFLPEFLPTIKDKESDFLKDLVSAVKNIREFNSYMPLPDWASNYYLPHEEAIDKDIKRIENQIKSLNAQLEEKNSAVNQLVIKKKLFTATGSELEKEVEGLFREIGFEILAVEDNRDDLIVRYNEQVAVVEIKGVANSAAEKHAAQLEKWTASYIEKNGVIPKGILLVNTYKEQPLINRADKSFPDQMLKYSTQREHCLITTLQLLGLYFEIQNFPDKKDELINSLFETVGTYTEFNNWQEFIKFKQTDQ
jgi:CRISPR/Cas system-associated exonuclease Cas4 (RecB family)